VTLVTLFCTPEISVTSVTSVTNVTERTIMKQHVQIPEGLFYDLVSFHLLDLHESEEKIRKGLAEKMDAIIRRGYYSQYKTEVDEAIRAEALRKYHDSADIFKGLTR
jgi:hypothetical protein